jgi:hypothetical protein
MPENTYDQAMTALSQASPIKTGTTYDSAMGLLKQDSDGDAARLRIAVGQAQDQNPDQAATDRRLALKFGVPMPVIARDRDQYLARENSDLPYGQVVKQTPHTAAFAAEPANAAVSHDDLAQLGGLEWLASAPSRAVAQALNEQKYAALRTQSLFRPLTTDERDQMESAKYAVESAGTLGADNWFKGAVTGGTKFLTFLGEAGVSGVKGLVGGAAAGALVGSVLPGAGTVAGALAGGAVGLEAGGAFGLAKTAFEGGAGPAYDEYSKLTDENGQPIAPGVAKMAAIAAGGINAALMGVSGEVVLKGIPGADKITGLFAKDAIGRALQQPTVRAALANLATRYGTTLAEGTALTVAQEAISIVGGEVAKQASGQPFEAATPTEVGQRLADAVKSGIQTFALAGLGGPAVDAARQIANVGRAQRNADFFRALGEGVAAAKTSERAPDAVGDLLTRATANGPIEKVYAPVDTWTSYWQSQNVDPAQMAEQVTGRKDALADAQRTGEDLTIPTARYATTIAATPHNEFFASELRLHPDEMNTREAIAFQQAAIATAKQEARAAEGGQPTPLQQIRTQVEQRMTAAGIAPESAAPLAQLMERGFALADQVGVDPLALFERMGLTIERPALGEAGKGGPGGGGAGTPPVEGAPPAEGAPAEPIGAQPPLPTEVPLAGLEPAAAAPAGGPAPNPNEPIAAMQNVGAAALRMFRENPDIATQARAMRERASAAGRIPEPPRGATIPAEGSSSAEQPTPGTAAGQVAAGHRGERAAADLVGSPEAGSAGAQPERRRLPSLTDVTAEEGTRPFARATPEEDAARLTPDVTRELQRMQDELHELTFQSRTWTFLGANDRKTGNAAGGNADIVAGGAGAPVYSDVLDFSPLSKSNKGEGAAKSVRGTRAAVESAIAKTIDSSLISSNLAEGAVRVAERRAADDYRDITLPPTWGAEATPEFVQEISDSIDSALENADTSFNPSEFGQSLLDLLTGDGPEGQPATDKVTTDLLDTGEQQPRLPEAGAVREQNVATPAVAEAPFALTSTVAAPERVKQAVRGPSAEYLAAKATADDADRAFADATKKYRAQEIGDTAYLAARAERDKAAQAFDRAYAKEEALGGDTKTLFQGATPEERIPGEARADGVHAVFQGWQEGFAEGDISIPSFPLYDIVGGARDRSTVDATELQKEGIPIPPTPEKPAEYYQSAPTSPAFREWFGDSKVVDDKANPLVVYHGTDKKFSRFNPKKGAQQIIWFTSDRAAVEARDVGAQGHGVTMQLYAKIEHPAGWAEYEKLGLAELEARGYDGAILPNQDGTITGFVFEPTQLKSAVRNSGGFDSSNPNIYKQTRRGAITFGPDMKVSIKLFEKADLSTFLHETGHFFLELMGDLSAEVGKVAEDARTPEQQRLLQNYEATLKALGVEKREDVGTAQHEQFARMFEAYLREGKAPSLELQGAFSKFRAWLLGIYKSLTQLGVTLTPDVRQVFDRMLATDEQIASAEARGRLDPLFTTPEGAGMTAAQFEPYRAAVEDAHRKATEQLDAKLLGEVRREQTRAWEAERTKTRAAVEATVQAQPVYRALAAIRAGQNADGSSLVEGMDVPPLKLSRQLIVERYGEEMLKRLPKPYIYAREGGVDPELVAERFGFSSGDDLLQAIQRAEPMQQAIDRETARQMIAAHGSMLLDGTLPEKAQAAAANDVRDGVIRSELRALWDLRRKVKPFVEQAKAEGRAAVKETKAAGVDALKKAGRESVDAAKQAEKERAYERRWLEAETKLRIAYAEGRKQVDIDRLERDVLDLRAQARGGPARIREAIPSAAVLKQTAEARIANTRVADVEPAVFWSASRRAAQQAIDSAARQDFDAAIKAKTTELLNLNLYRTAERAKEDIVERVSKAKDLANPANRARIALSGSTFLEQIDGILDRYNFKRFTSPELDRRANMRDWLEAMEAQGLPVDSLPAEVRDDLRRADYQTISYAELQGVTDGLQQLVHLSRLTEKLLKSESDKKFAVVRDGLSASIRANNKPGKVPLEFDRAAERHQFISDVFASHTKVGTLARMIDGHEDGGAMWEAIIRPINAAQDEEQRRRTDEGENYRAIIDEHFPTAAAKRMGDKALIPEINGSLSREARLAVVLTRGNDDGLKRLLSDTTRRWTQSGIDAVASSLDPTDLAFVNATWKYLDRFWPEIAAKEKRLTGLEPTRVDAIPFTVRASDGTDVEMTGGYYPLVYDSRLAPRADQNQLAQAGNMAAAASYVRTTTQRGHTLQRAENVKMPVRLDLGTVFSHVDQVLHDLTHHEMLIDVTRLMRDPGVTRAMLETRGQPVYQQFVRLLNDVAAGSTSGASRPNVLDRAATFMRTGTQLSLMGFNLWTAAQQPLGVFNGMERVGAKWVARGMVRWMRDAATMQNTNEWIGSVSSFMGHRRDTLNQDIADVRQRLRQPGGWFDKLVSTVSRDKVTQHQLLDAYLWHIEKMQQVADIPTWLGGYEKAMADTRNEGDETRAIALADQAVRDSQGSGAIVDLAQVQRGSPMVRLFLTFYSYGNVVFNRSAAILDSLGSGRTTVPAAIGHFGLLYAMPAAATVAMMHAFGKRSNAEGPEEWAKEFAEEALSTAMNTMVLVREFSGAIGEGTRGYAGPAGARAIQLGYNLVDQIKQGEPDEGLAKALNQVGGVLFRYPALQAERTAEGFAALQEGRTTNPLALLFGAPPAK